MGYAILVVGFGLDFRPLHHDEVVTLHVAGQPSVGDVLHVAIWDRHGPPLHYLVVHASLDWRHDILGLRLPSALFGILAVGLAYGCGRCCWWRRIRSASSRSPPSWCSWPGSAGTRS